MRGPSHRELQNFIERAVILSPQSRLHAPTPEPEPFRSNKGCDVPMKGLAEVERDHSFVRCKQLGYQWRCYAMAVGGEKSFGPLQAVIMRNVATNVLEAVVAGSGHWLMDERPAETVALRNFLDSP